MGMHSVIPQVYGSMSAAVMSKPRKKRIPLRDAILTADQACRLDLERLVSLYGPDVVEAVWCEMVEQIDPILPDETGNPVG